jgi:hypothetical protein
MIRFFSILFILFFSLCGPILNQTQTLCAGKCRLSAVFLGAQTGSNCRGSGHEPDASDLRVRRAFSSHEALQMWVDCSDGSTLSVRQEHFVNPARSRRPSAAFNVAS